MKIFTYYNNPLNRLIELLQRQSQISNRLLLQLITRCAEEIRPNDQELIQHCFLDPARDTCTYVVLFTDSFAKLPVRRETLDRLAQIWSRWEEQQLKYEEIWRKKNYTPDQKFYFDKIWEIVGKYSGKQYQVGILFETAQKDMMEKTRMKEKITTSLNEYCQQGIDKKDYEDLLLTMQYQMEHSLINEIRVPPELKGILPFVERLIPFSRSNVWLQYYTIHLQQLLAILLGKKRQELMDKNQDEHWNDFDGEDDTNEEISQYYFNYTSISDRISFSYSCNCYTSDNNRCRSS